MPDSEPESARTTEARVIYGPITLQLNAHLHLMAIIFDAIWKTDMPSRRSACSWPEDLAGEVGLQTRGSRQQAAGSRHQAATAEDNARTLDTFGSELVLGGSGASFCFLFIAIGQMH